MAIMARAWRRSRRGPSILSADVTLFLLCCVSVIITGNAYHLNLKETLKKIEMNLAENSKLYKGKGCLLPSTDPFSKEATLFERKVPVIKCHGNIDWVKCNNSYCRVVYESEYLLNVNDIVCEYRDIIYHSDSKYTIGPATVPRENSPYRLTLSDHVKVACNGTSFRGKQLRWSGNTLGFREVEPKKPPPQREHTFNVLIFAFDSTSRNGFMRLMPKSWKVLTEELGATVMEGYNIVGEATPAAIIPILTGHTELELPEARRSQPNSTNVDAYPFIFYKLKEDGYRTAYFEDMPYSGTFQWRLKGFLRQPTDHYLRAFFLEEGKMRTKYCVGSKPQHKLLMEITEQFMKLNGKRFIFTFVGLTHDSFNLAQAADTDMAAFLTAFKIHYEDTLLVVMSDHGPRCSRYKAQCKILPRKFEERQPLMALRLPAALVRDRPEKLAALQANARVLTTPHDLHATLLDVLDMRQHWNPYRVPGADLPRGLTMLEPIPRNRSCSDAGIELHWCACVTWQNLTTADPLYNTTAFMLLEYINSIESEAGSLCLPRTLRSVMWVRREQPHLRLLEFAGNADTDGFTSTFGETTIINEDKYKTRIMVGPARDIVEASLTYIVNKNEFLIRNTEISWINNDWICPSALSDFLFIAYDWRITVLNRTVRVPITTTKRPYSYNYDELLDK